jgi:hypothetical protein
MFKTSDGQIKKIAVREGYRSKAYRPIPGKDKNGNWNSNLTIGHGQENELFPGTPGAIPVTEGLSIDKAMAWEALCFFVYNVTDPLVTKYCNPQTQAEHDACASWVYNIRQFRLVLPENHPDAYTLPKLLRLKDRSPPAMQAIIDCWLQYCLTPGGENGLYKRRLEEVLTFQGLPITDAVLGYIESARVARRDKGQTLPNATYMHPSGKFVASVSPSFLIEMAEAAKPIPSLPDPPKPAKPVVPVKVEPLPEVKPEPQIGTKPISPKTVKPEEVPYKIDPNAGLKPLEESERAIGYFWQNLARLFLRLTGLGTFGTAAAGVANVVQSDAVLGSALLDLTIPLLVFVTGIVIAFVAKQYGDWRRKRGEESASQGMY